jgi:hypothetical protein
MLAKVGARLLSFRLDARLTEGEDPSRSPLLAARAAQLANPRMRRKVAEGLDRIALGLAPAPGWWRVVPAAMAVQANRGELLELAARLRAQQAVYARGVAAARLIVADGAGPAYTDRRGDGLAFAVRCARVLLSG